MSNSHRITAADMLSPYHRWVARHRAVAYGIVMFLVACLGIVIVAAAVTARPDTTHVAFLDVGQGDGILITRGGRQILIDGGADGRLLMERLAARMPFWDRHVDVLVATHPDTDHIGAQVAVLRTMDVGMVVATDAFKDSPAATAWHGAITERRVPVVMADAATVIRLVDGDDAAGVLQVVYPRTVADVVAAGEDANAASIVTRLSVADTTFLLTGDLPEEKESLIVTDPVTVLKAGHHGSRTSSGSDFLLRIRPRDAVISVGADNRYGHPSQEALDRLVAAGADVIRTDERGTITYVCPVGGCRRDTDR